MRAQRFFLPILLLILPLSPLRAQPDQKQSSQNKDLKLPFEDVSGAKLWVHDKVKKRLRRGPVQVKVWFDKQLLGSGPSYMARARTLRGWTRSKLRAQSIKTLQSLAKQSWIKAEPALKAAMKNGSIQDLEKHWIINGFTCTLKNQKGLQALQSIPTVKKIFYSGSKQRKRAKSSSKQFFKASPQLKFNPQKYQHPWYTRALLADKVWKELGITGKGTLNVIHDGHFQFNDNLTANLYRNPHEIPGNGKDDDGNGLIDDYHGWNFVHESSNLSPRNQSNARASSLSHGFNCAAIISGVGRKNAPYEFGLAPESQWAGIIAGRRIEAAVEWAILHKADTYSMSFSIPNLGEYRSHWRKVLEHGSFCGVYFVSGAGNFARDVPTPIQMRTPEDIPHAVFAAAGIQRDFSRTPFSSQGPVLWKTEHYQEGLVQKPAVCAFNHKLPKLHLDGQVSEAAISGNSFAGPMYCGTISLMLSADPELLPWDLREIITSTATDVGEKGFDPQTGHGLINSYRAVKEVLRRRALREGRNPQAFQGRSEGDCVTKAPKKVRRCVVVQVQKGSQADILGVKRGDLIDSIAGQRPTNQAELRQALRPLKEKETYLRLIFRRGEKALKLELSGPRPGFRGALKTIYQEPVFKP